MKWALVSVALCACGRLDFAPVAIATDGSPDVATACVAPFSTVSGGCYQVVPVAATWPAAEAMCESENAHVIVVADVAEHTVLHTLLGDAGLARGWLGYTDRVTEGTFLWVAPPGVDPSTNGCFFGSNPNLTTTDCATQDGPPNCPDWSVHDCAIPEPYVCERDNRVIDTTSY